MDKEEVISKLKKKYGGLFYYVPDMYCYRLVRKHRDGCKSVRLHFFIETNEVTDFYPNRKIKPSAISIKDGLQYLIKTFLTHE